MATYLEQVDLPYAPRQVFDLVADIESYPRFLPHVESARITRRDGSSLWVTQLVRFQMLRLDFSTHAVLEPPSSIRVVCTDSPLGTFVDQWSFAANSTGGTHLKCRTEFEFRSGLLRVTIGFALGEVLRSTVRAFELRARKLYGTRPPSG